MRVQPRLATRAALASACLLILASPAAAATCGPVEALPDEGHHHLISGAEPPVPYGSVPPTSGWHFRERGEVDFGVFEPGQALSEPHQVSVLAVGGVVITYRDLDSDDVATLSALAAAEVEAGRPVALSPYDALEPGQVALTAWNLRQLCDGLDDDAAAAFIAEHAAAAPDFDMRGDDDTHAGHDANGTGDEPAPASARDGLGPVLVVVGLALLGLFAVAAGYALRPRNAAR